MTTVMTFGTFDGIHKGHEYYLQKAKEFGDFLVVVVARDETAQQVKGKLPTYREHQRLQHVQDLGIADCVVLGNPGDKLQVVVQHKPDVICLGYDQRSFTDSLREKLQKRSLNPKIIRVAAFKPEIYKSSLLKS